MEVHRHLFTGWITSQVRCPVCFGQLQVTNLDAGWLDLLCSCGVAFAVDAAEVGEALRGRTDVICANRRVLGELVRSGVGGAFTVVGPPQPGAARLTYLAQPPIMRRCGDAILQAVDAMGRGELETVDLDCPECTGGLDHADLVIALRELGFLAWTEN